MHRLGKGQYKDQFASRHCVITITEGFSYIGSIIWWMEAGVFMRGYHSAAE